MEEVEGGRILAGRHENAISADGDELTEVFVALRILHVQARIGRIVERIHGVRAEGAAGRARVDIGAAIEVGAIRGGVRRSDAFEVKRLKLPLQVAGTVVGVKVGAAVAPHVPASTPGIVEHIKIAGRVFADADDAGETLVADLTFDSLGSVEITALNAE